MEETEAFEAPKAPKKKSKGFGDLTITVPEESLTEATIEINKEDIITVVIPTQEESPPDSAGHRHHYHEPRPLTPKKAVVRRGLKGATKVRP